MYYLQNHTMTKEQETNLSLFLTQYGISGLEQALRLYMDMQQTYTCKTKTSISKFKISDIYYLKIQEHMITIHTQHGIFQKYGTLNNELKLLAPYGFLKCNQSCLISMQKIRTIQNNDIILINGECIHMSRHYAPKIILTFSRSAV